MKGTSMSLTFIHFIIIYTNGGVGVIPGGIPSNHILDMSDITMGLLQITFIPIVIKTITYLII